MSKLVEIRIDTSKDSKDDIKKTIRFLEGFLGTDAGIYKKKEPESEPAGMFNMFGDAGADSEEEHIVIDKPQERTEARHDKPEVVFKPILY